MIASLGPAAGSIALAFASPFFFFLYPPADLKSSASLPGAAPRREEADPRLASRSAAHGKVFGRTFSSGPFSSARVSCLADVVPNK